MYQYTFMELLSSKSSKATDNQVGKQDYQLSQLMSSFRKLYVQYKDIVSKYKLLLGQMLTYIFWIFLVRSFLINKLYINCPCTRLQERKRNGFDWSANDVLSSILPINLVDVRVCFASCCRLLFSNTLLTTFCHQDSPSTPKWLG